jgi:hypothetical protein
MLTPRQFHEAVKEIRRLREAIDKKDKERGLKEHHLKYDVYQPKIIALEKERDDEIRRVIAEFEAFEEKRNQEMTPFIDSVFNVTEITNLMSIAIGAPDDLPIEIYSYRDIDDNGNYYKDGNGNYEARKIIYSPIDTLVQDQYKNIQVFIVRNKKPINKYTLTIQGKSLFYNRLDHILPERNSYIQGIDENTNIRQTLKEAPTVEALKKWYDKNKAHLLKDIKSTGDKNLNDLSGRMDFGHFLVEHAKLEVQYEEAKILYKRPEWKALYVELWRNDHTHQGDDEYNDYTVISTTLSRSPKDLVLLVGQLKTEEGKKMLEQFLKE